MTKVNHDYVPDDLSLIPANDTDPERVKTKGGEVYRAIRCPYCGAICFPADTEDVGHGGGPRGQQVEPHLCEVCGAHEASPHTEPGTDDGVDRCGWFAGEKSPPL